MPSASLRRDSSFPRLLRSLYRTVLGSHRRHLPPELRPLGDAYAKEEFRRHLAAATTPKQWMAFGEEWARYAALLAGEEEGAAAHAGPRRNVNDDLVGSLSEAQKATLEKLREEAMGGGGGGSMSLSPEDGSSDDKGGKGPEGPA